MEILDELVDFWVRTDLMLFSEIRRLFLFWMSFEITKEQLRVFQVEELERMRLTAGLRKKVK